MDCTSVQGTEANGRTLENSRVGFGLCSEEMTQGQCYSGLHKCTGNRVQSQMGGLRKTAEFISCIIELQYYNQMHKGPLGTSVVHKRPLGTSVLHKSPFRTA